MILLSSEVTGVVTWVGTFLTIVGLIATFFQAREARRAAKDAANQSSRAEIAVARLERELSIADAAHVSAQTDSILHFVIANQIVAAQVVYDQVKRKVQFLVLKSSLDDLQKSGVNRNITIIGKQLGYAASDPSKYKQHTLAASISGLGSFLVEIEGGIASTREI